MLDECIELPMPKSRFRLDPHLWAAIDYESHANRYGQDEGRFHALTTQLRRLSDRQPEIATPWLPTLNPVSFHVVDWDLRKDGDARSNNRVPFWVGSPLVHVWYGLLGLAVSRGEPWMKGSLTHHAFDMMRNRHAIEISVSATAEPSLAVSRSSLPVAHSPLGVAGGDCAVNAPEPGEFTQGLVRVHISHGLIREFLQHRPRLADLFSWCDDAVQDTRTQLIEGVALTDAVSCALSQAKGVPHLASKLDALVSTASDHLSCPRRYQCEDAHILLGYEADEFGARGDLQQAFRQFIVSAGVLCALTPPSLEWRNITLVPGTSCVEKGTAEAAEGFFIVHRSPLADEDWYPWLTLANLWSREKAVFDLREKAIKAQEERDKLRIAGITYGRGHRQKADFSALRSSLENLQSELSESEPDVQFLREEADALSQSLHRAFEVTKNGDAYAALASATSDADVQLPTEFLAKPEEPPYGIVEGLRRVLNATGDELTLVLPENAEDRETVECLTIVDSMSTALSKNCRLRDSFYDELFEDVLANAYHYSEDQSVAVHGEAIKSEGRQCLYVTFANTVSDSTLERLSRNGVALTDTWKPWPENTRRMGGLTARAQRLRWTRRGDLFAKCEYRAGVKWFCLAMQLTEMEERR